MLEFTKALKLYVFLDRDLVSLSVMSSPCHVLTFYMPLLEFEQLLEASFSPQGCETPKYFVQCKRGKDHVRFTHRGSGFDTNLRIAVEKWELLARDFRAKRLNPGGELITCEVD